MKEGWAYGSVVKYFLSTCEVQSPESRNGNVKRKVQFSSARIGRGEHV